MSLIRVAPVVLGIEILKCPRCSGPNHIEIHSDLPEQDYLTCKYCGYKALLNYIPILDKYGLPHGLSQEEKRQIGQHLQTNIDRLN
jgi:DNA-directed RNA polymerase subunit RPC12/RpoP